MTVTVSDTETVDSADSRGDVSIKSNSGTSWLRGSSGGADGMAA
jgi:hypothetical protein